MHKLGTTLHPKNMLKKVKQLTERILQSRKYSQLAGLILIVIIIGIASLVSIKRDGVQSVDSAIAANESKIGTDDVLLKQYIKKYGADATIAYVKTLPIDCHQRVHKVGRLTYELKGSDAFTILNSECMSGYTHGVTEAFFHEHGTENLTVNLELICQGQQFGFYSNQCFHGVGHGLMAFNDYDLPAALKSCDTLPEGGQRWDSCYTGVFMENVVGAIGVEDAKASNGDHDYHTSSWLSSDPQFPCNAVELKYKQSCYIFQTSRMIQIPNFDYRKVAQACADIEAEYQVSCFFSMGRDVSNSFGSNYEEIEKTCSYIPASDLRLKCIEGASQDKFWHESEQEDALGMCRAMTESSAKQSCYNTIASRGREIIDSRDNRRMFCAKFEPGYKELCSPRS